MSKYFSTWPVTVRVVRALAFLSILLLLGACGNSGSSVSGQTTGTALTIDNAGVVPVFGVVPTSTVVYVHNNSSSTISGITYTLTDNSSGSIDGSQCVAIAAGQSCALKIITPSLSNQENQGSMQIKASYVLANKAYLFSQLINYALVDDASNNSVAGVKFKSGATISGYGNSTGYATLYLYASGVNQVYTITDLSASQPSLKFNMSLKNITLSSNSVQAIEVSSPILSSSISASLTVQSILAPSNGRQRAHLANSSLQSNSLQADQFSDSVSVTVYSNSAGAILTTGTVPLINTSNGTSGTMVVQNTGNQAATIGTVSAGAGISGLSGCSNATLAVGDLCYVNFNVTESGGSANITVPYTGGNSNSVSGNVTWFNGAGSALVTMSIANNPMSFSATVGATTQVTVTNIGSYTLSNIVIPAPQVLGGSATANVVSGGVSDCVTGGELGIGNSCSYSVAVNDSATDLDQQINLGFQASYTGNSGVSNYSSIVPLTYSSTSYGAIIGLSTLSAMSISGNNLESATQGLTISNNGAAAADLTGFSLINNPTYLVASSGNCSGSLAGRSSCTAQIKLGPVSSYLESSGVSNYVVSYAAVGQTPAGVESTSVAWSVAPNLPSINMVASVTGCASGNGITTTCMDNPTATGGSSSNIQVVLTFTNSSSATAATTISLPESSSSLFTVPGYSLFSNSCTNGAAANNGSCTIIYTLPSSATTTAFQSSLSRSDFAYNYTYGASGEVSASGTSNLATMIDVVMPTLAIESITTIVQGGQSTATINWGNLYQATVPTTNTSATESNGSTVEGLSSATPATCGSVASNIASCTSVITTTDSTPAGIGYLLNASAAGGISGTPESFNVVLSNNIIFVTSGTWTGNLGGYSGADAKCNADANKPSGSAAGAGKTYKALLNGNNATTFGVTYYRTNGITSIAGATGGNLVGAASLVNTIGLVNSFPWTGATSNCNFWTTTTGVGHTGVGNQSDSKWWSNITPTCITLHALYCVAQ